MFVEHAWDMLLFNSTNLFLQVSSAVLLRTASWLSLGGETLSSAELPEETELRLRDWFFEQKTRCPKAPLMPSSRTAGFHYRNSFISLISVGAWTWYEISLQLWWNKFNWDKNYFYFLCDYIFKPVSLMATFLKFCLFYCRLIFLKTLVTRGKFLRSFGSPSLPGQVHCSSEWELFDLTRETWSYTVTCFQMSTCFLQWTNVVLAYWFCCCLIHIKSLVKST